MPTEFTETEDTLTLLYAYQGQQELLAKRAMEHITRILDILSQERTRDLTASSEASAEVKALLRILKTQRRTMELYNEQLSRSLATLVGERDPHKETS
jgi:hypothetical protein